MRGGIRSDRGTGLNRGAFLQHWRPIAALLPERQTEWSTPYILAVPYNAFIPLTLCWFLWLYTLAQLSCIGLRREALA